VGFLLKNSVSIEISNGAKNIVIYNSPKIKPLKAKKKPLK